MEELLLAEAHRELYGLVWSNLQWWASVSFGLLALASFGRKHLNLLTTIGLSVLYVLFSIFTAINVFFALVPSFGVTAELAALQDSGAITRVGESILMAEQWFAGWNGIILWISFTATFFGTLAYVWYSYRKNKGTNQNI